MGLIRVQQGQCWSSRGRAVSWLGMDTLDGRESRIPVLFLLLLPFLPLFSPSSVSLSLWSWDLLHCFVEPLLGVPLIPQAPGMLIPGFPEPPSPPGPSQSQGKGIGAAGWDFPSSRGSGSGSHPAFLHPRCPRGRGGPGEQPGETPGCCCPIPILGLSLPSPAWRSQLFLTSHIPPSTVLLHPWLPTGSSMTAAGSSTQPRPQSSVPQFPHSRGCSHPSAGIRVHPDSVLFPQEEDPFHPKIQSVSYGLKEIHMDQVRLSGIRWDPVGSSGIRAFPHPSQSQSLFSSPAPSGLSHAWRGAARCPPSS